MGLQENDKKSLSYTVIYIMQSLTLQIGVWYSVGMGIFPDSLCVSAKKVNDAMHRFKKCASDTSWHLYRDASFLIYLHW